jgi:hypothetical protein
VSDGILSNPILDKTQRDGYSKNCATILKVPGSIPGSVTGDLFRGIRPFHVLGVDSTSKNKYHDTPGIKTAGAYG